MGAGTAKKVGVLVGPKDSGHPSLGSSLLEKKNKRVETMAYQARQSSSEPKDISGESSKVTAPKLLSASQGILGRSNCLPLTNQPLTGRYGGTVLGSCWEYENLKLGFEAHQQK